MLSLQDILLERPHMTAARKHARIPQSDSKGGQPEERIIYTELPEADPQSEAFDEKVAGAAIDIQGMIDEVLVGKPFRIETEDAFLKGKDLLGKLHQHLLKV